MKRCLTHSHSHSLIYISIAQIPMYQDSGLITVPLQSRRSPFSRVRFPQAHHFHPVKRALLHHLSVVNVRGCDFHILIN